jgi:hypothetical protein
LNVIQVASALLPLLHNSYQNTFHDMGKICYIMHDLGHNLNTVASVAQGYDHVVSCCCTSGTGPGPPGSTAGGHHEEEEEDISAAAELSGEEWARLEELLAEQVRAAV